MGNLRKDTEKEVSGGQVFGVILIGVALLLIVAFVIFVCIKKLGGDDTTEETNTTTTESNTTSYNTNFEGFDYDEINVDLGNGYRAII